jgi:hypothetical protein
LEGCFCSLLLSRSMSYTMMLRCIYLYIQVYTNLREYPYLRTRRGGGTLAPTRRAFAHTAAAFSHLPLKPEPTR